MGALRQEVEMLRKQNQEYQVKSGLTISTLTPLCMLPASSYRLLHPKRTTRPFDCSGPRLSAAVMCQHIVKSCWKWSVYMTNKHTMYDISWYGACIYVHLS